MTAAYIKAYNFLSCILWALLAVYFWTDFYKAAISWIIPLTIVQGLAIIDIAHVITGLISTSLFTTSIQYLSRMFVTGVLFIANYTWPLRDDSFVYVGTLLIFIAWPLAEMIRFGFYLKPTHPLMTWLRYSAFIILYPLGVFAESLVMGRVMLFSIHTDGYRWAALLIFTFVMYIFFFPKLYGYLWKQRRKKL